MRRAWDATSAAERTAALTSAVTGLSLTTAEQTTERTQAQTQLNASTGDLWSTAVWAVGEICDRVASAGATAIAATGRATDLSTECTTLSPFYAARQSRISSSTHVEIVQNSGQPSSSTSWVCDPSNPHLTALHTSTRSAYTSNQMDNVAKLYLQVAATEGRYPNITTHFLVDSSMRGHCDPRCFDLGDLYARIAALVGHPTTTNYGLVPSYGTTFGTNNIWWLNSVCGGSHP
jgi:hypothetical protein